jgi:glycosyltransferase involved in cell wall biosynthesis
MSTRARENSPDVSVVMPVHDMPLKYVRRAIRSVRKQDHPGAIEVVLWDDGSRDPYRVGAYAAMGTAFDDEAAPGTRTISTHRGDTQQGIACSRNDAVSRAGADWLMWLDGDDELPTDAVRRLLGSVRRSGNQYAIGQCRVVYGFGVSQVHHNEQYLAAWQQHRGTENDPLTHVVFNTHGGLVHRELFERSGRFRPEFTHAELVDWFRRLFRALPNRQAFDVLRSVTYIYRKREGSHSSNRTLVRSQRVEALQRYASAEGMPPAELDAPVVNIATGCPEYKRVERDQESAGVEFLDRVPARP